MPNIFISYSRHRETVAKTLAADLEALGHTAWFDQGLTGGLSWWDQILNRVRDCGVFVFVLDRNSLESAACQREYTYAADLGKPILPVLVEDGISIDLLPPVLAQIQFVDYRIQDRNAAFRLAKAISTVETKPLPNPLPVPPPVPVSYLGSLAERIDSAAMLSYEAQSTLVVDLRRGLRDPKSMKDSRTLLVRLRQRRDLFANIAEEIDEFLGPVAAVAEIHAPKLEPPVVAPLKKKKDGLESKRKFQLDHSEPQSSQSVPVALNSTESSLLKERVNGAITLGAIGMAAGILCLAVFSIRFGPTTLINTHISMIQYSGYIPWYLFGVGGAVAGAISGRNRAKKLGAITGIGIAAAVACLASGPSAPSYYLPGLLAPPLGSLFAVYLGWRTAANS